VRSLVDESTGPAVARWLREQHHDVVSVFDEARGISDDEVIRRAYIENRILITNDKDFEGLSGTVPTSRSRFTAAGERACTKQDSSNSPAP
jgi:predicted nuclease of predicted toxin-antitoxin system